MYSFQYERPATSADAVRAASSGDVRYLAGGQSLVQSMRLRLSASDRLVDLGGIAELVGITREGDSIVVGAMTRHADVARSEEVRSTIPGLAELAGGIGDQMVRNCGTIGGSIANADPAACYPAAVLALGATIRTNTREIAADDFFLGLYETALEPNELITAVVFPIPDMAAYHKYVQPASRFALLGVMVVSGPAGVRVAVTGARDRAYRCGECEQALSGGLNADALANVKISAEGLNRDLHASAEYRAAMIPIMAARAVARASSR